MEKNRQEKQPPLAIREWGWRYHHAGFPTNEPIKEEKYLEHLKCYVGGFTTCPFGIEWMRFEPGSPVHELIKKIPHIAFEVDDIDSELLKHDFNILSKPSAPGKGIRVAMIEHNGVPVELIEFKK